MEKINDKKKNYTRLTNQIKGLIKDENDPIAYLSNSIAAIHESMNFLWTGIYFVKNNELVLGPFQGPVACTRIQRGNGVCGTAWVKRETIIVPDVNKFPGHIACSSFSNSELVTPVFNEKAEVTKIIDIDSREKDFFNNEDREFFEEIAELIKNKDMKVN